MYIDICIWCAKYNEYGENMVSSVGEIGTKRQISRSEISRGWHLCELFVLGVIYNVCI